MRVNADFKQKVVLYPDQQKWVDSPTPGVERMMLDRVGGEVARATSLVRFAPGSRFPAHNHDGGEEFLVLDGEFVDEHGSYPAGSYLRNPPGTHHSPGAGPDGALLFVKLLQFDPGDLAEVAVNTRQQEWSPGLVPGLSVLPLHEFRGKHTALVKWEPFTRFNQHAHFGGEEILVLEGTFQDEFGEYPAGTWIRSPHGSRHTPFTVEEGALIYVKTGHLEVDNTES